MSQSPNKYCIWYTGFNYPILIDVETEYMSIICLEVIWPQNATSGELNYAYLSRIFVR